MTSNPGLDTLYVMRRSLGDAIRERVGNDTLEAHSLACGWDKNQLSRWANGGVEPSPKSYEKLQEFLGVTLDELGALIVETQRRRHLGQRPL